MSHEYEKFVRWEPTTSDNEAILTCSCGCNTRLRTVDPRDNAKTQVLQDALESPCKYIREFAERTKHADRFM